MTKIAFTGKAGSGKTSLAEKYVKEGYVKLSFADAVKFYAKEILMRQINKHDPEDREFLQKLGTDLARRRDPDIWVKHLAARFATFKEFTEDFVVDDCRFKNEAEWLQNNGFVLVKVVGRGYALPKQLASHPSETEVDEIEADLTIDNSGLLKDTLEQLQIKIAEYERSTGK